MYSGHFLVMLITRFKGDRYKEEHSQKVKNQHESKC